MRRIQAAEVAAERERQAEIFAAKQAEWPTPRDAGFRFHFDQIVLTVRG